MVFNMFMIVLNKTVIINSIDIHHHYDQQHQHRHHLVRLFDEGPPLLLSRPACNLQDF